MDVEIERVLSYNENGLRLKIHFDSSILFRRNETYFKTTKHNKPRAMTLSKAITVVVAARSEMTIYKFFFFSTS